MCGQAIIPSATDLMELAVAELGEADAAAIAEHAIAAATLLVGIARTKPILLHKMILLTVRRRGVCFVVSCRLA